MSLYLVHLKMDGTPVGIWNSQGQSFYMPGESKFEKRGEQIVGSVTDETPWPDFVDTKSQHMNYQEIWTDYQSNLGLQDALDAFTAQANANNSTNTSVDA